MYSIGDVMDALLALMVMKTCAQIEGGLPSALRVKMMINIILDFVIGLVPFLGDVADAAFKANSRNAMLLESHLREKGQKALRQSGLPVPAVDPSSPEEFDRLQNNSGHGDRSPLPSRQPSARSARQNPSQPMPSEPARAEVRGGSGWWNKSRPRDVEMGEVGNTRSDSHRNGGRSGRR